MGRKSTMDSLPEKIRAQVNFLLGEGGWTIDQVVDYLKQAGHPRSRSAVGRKKQELSKVSERLRQSREITETLVKEIGPAAQDGKQGRLLTEILRSLVYDHLVARMEDDSEGLESQEFFFLAKALREMSQGTRFDQDFEDKIRAQVAREEREKAADEAVTQARQAGVSGDKAEEMRQKILGVKPA